MKTYRKRHTRGGTRRPRVAFLQSLNSEHKKILYNTLFFLHPKLLKNGVKSEMHENVDDELMHVIKYTNGSIATIKEKTFEELTQDPDVTLPVLIKLIVFFVIKHNNWYTLDDKESGDYIKGLIAEPSLSFRRITYSVRLWKAALRKQKWDTMTLGSTTGGGQTNSREKILNAIDRLIGNMKNKIIETVLKHHFTIENIKNLSVREVIIRYLYIHSELYRRDYSDNAADIIVLMAYELFTDVYRFVNQCIDRADLYESETTNPIYDKETTSLLIPVQKNSDGTVSI